MFRTVVIVTVTLELNVSNNDYVRTALYDLRVVGSETLVMRLCTARMGTSSSVYRVIIHARHRAKGFRHFGAKTNPISR